MVGVSERRDDVALREFPAGVATRSKQALVVGHAVVVVALRVEPARHERLATF